MTVSPDLDNRFREAAAAAGLIDAAFDLADTPIGTLLRRGDRPRPVPDLVRLRIAGWTSCPARSAGGCCACRAGSIPPGASWTSTSRAAAPSSTCRWTSSAWRTSTGSCSASSPSSRTARSRPTATLAAKVGRPRAARAVGVVMNRNPIPIVLPCHRVIGANGSLTGYGGGLDRKQALLELEGALLSSN